MKSNSQITYILLERGIEDRALWLELNKIITDLRFHSYKTFAEKFPLLWELKQNLEIEFNEEDLDDDY